MEEMQKPEFIEIHWTCGSLDEARKVCRYTVQERFVATAKIVPWLESVYMWNNQLETVQESKVIMQTRADFFEKVKKIIEDNCSYEVPEIIFFKIDGVNPAYLEWLETSTPQNFNTQDVTF